MPRAIKITAETLPIIEAELEHPDTERYLLTLIKLEHSTFFVTDISPISPLPSHAVYYEEYFYDTFYFTDPAYDKTQFADVRHH